uniref:demethylmenaquinone methyltransferase-like isoform X2 n=1 Tax=Myxine glutinosa TaxID=7769 RepID=UPI00358FD39F
MAGCMGAWRYVTSLEICRSLSNVIGPRHLLCRYNAAYLYLLGHVLELGFGPGVGLKDALAKLGPHGHLYGVDPSEYMHSVASRRLASGIQTGQVQLFSGTAESLPLPDGIIDRVFHCNCYYFWPDLDKACNEIKRVMKPGAFMVTTLSISVLRMLEEYGVFKDVKWQPQPYMEALQRANFTDVNMKSFQQGSFKYQAIFAAVK